MRRRDFETMVRAMARELPAEFLSGIEGITVTPKTVPHPVRAEVYTLGECVPHDFAGEPAAGRMDSARRRPHGFGYTHTSGVHQPQPCLVVAAGAFVGLPEEGQGDTVAGAYLVRAEVVADQS